MAIIAEISGGSQRPALSEAFRLFPKIFSYIWLSENQLPVLSGMVFCDFSEASLEIGKSLSREWGWQSFLLRRDCGHRDYFQGGMLLEWQELVNLLRTTTRDCLLFVLEPYDATENDYNISARVEKEKLIVEVAGPGFDASDLQRGHAVPHEIYEVSRIHSRTPKRLHLASTDEYRESVVLRKEKVSKKYVEKANRFSLDGENVDIDWRPPSEYVPISKEKLGLVMQPLWKLLPTADAVFSQPYTIASSFLAGGARLVFWDIYAGEHPFVASRASY